MNGTTNTTADNVAAGLNGVSALVALSAAYVGAPAIATAAVAAGVVLGTYIVARDIQNIVSSPEGATALDYAKLGVDAVGTVTGAFGALKAGTGVISEVTAWLEAAGTTGQGATAIQLGGFLSNVGGVGVGLATIASEANKEAQNAVPAVPIADVIGSAQVTNSEGPILSGLTGVDLSLDPNGSASITCVADESGVYVIPVPLGVTGIDYSQATLVTFDPVTDTDTGAPVSLDLSAAQPGQTISGPGIGGVCDDTDTGNPDGDDPDCD